MKNHSLRTVDRFLAVAARRVRERIRQDYFRVDCKLKPALHYLEFRYLDSSLTITGWRRACNLQKPSDARAFQGAVGCTPRDYLAQCRLEVATRLLEETNLAIWKIGTMVGYRSLSAFSGAFKNWAGLRPRSYREAAWRVCLLDENETLCREKLARAMIGLLPGPQALALLRHLLDLYPFLEVWQKRVLIADSETREILRYLEPDPPGE